MRISDLKQEPLPTRVCVGETGEIKSMADFALMIQKMGGKVIGFVDPAKGVNLSESDIDKMVEKVNGRSI